MKNNLVLIGLLLFITQCASLGGTYEKEKIQKIRKIAIVGFSYDMPLETGDHMMSALMGKEKSVGPGMMAGQKMETASNETPASRQVYDQLVANLKKTGWQVRNAEDVKNSPSVKAFYNKNVKIGYLPLAQGDGRFERDGIPQYVHVASLKGKNEFAKMAKDLGVDAVAVVYVQAKGSQTIPFVTTLKHSASFIFQIFDPNTDSLAMLYTNDGKEVEGLTKTKLGKDFETSVQKGTLASVDKFGDDLKKRLKD